MFKRSSRIAEIAALLAVMAGCQSANLRPGSLPPEFRAAAGNGSQRVQIAGLQSLGSFSSEIGPGDLLNVTVVTGVEETPPEAVAIRVDDRGVADIPYVGQVAVRGLEPADAAQSIAKASIERGIYRQPQVQVVVAEQATHRVTVLGSVTNPGVHEVPRSSCDIVTAIAAAGGFKEDAGAVVEVLRRDTGAYAAASSPEAQGGGVQQVSYNQADARAEKFDLNELSRGGGGSQQLGDRDVVIVRPREKRVVHVTGMVKTPNRFELIEDYDLRVLDAIAMAGGATSVVADKVIVVRQLPNQAAPVTIEVSIADAKRNSDENIRLQSGDLVSVEATVATTVVSTMSTLFRVTMGVGGNMTLF